MCLIAIWIHSLKTYPFRSLAHFWCVCVCVCVLIERHALFACFADELLVDIFAFKVFFHSEGCHFRSLWFPLLCKCF